MSSIVDSKLASFTRRERRQLTESGVPCAFPVLVLLGLIILHHVHGANERRQDIINDDVDVLSTITILTFSVLSVLGSSSDFTMGDVITLEKNETFDGNDSQIILNSTYAGLFQISEIGTKAPSSLEDAPVIQCLHMIGGDTEGNGGFIIQEQQNHFIVDSCSSSGEIRGDRSGSICGSFCSGDILILNCWSSGDIIGEGAGGIAGNAIGAHCTITLTNSCHAPTGGITGEGAGGVCAQLAGAFGYLLITHSCSTGKIDGEWSGG